MNKIKFILVLFILLGCATTGKLMKIKLDMTKEEVIKEIGKPNTLRGSIKNKYGEVIEVYEYNMYKTDSDAMWDRPTFYWLFFVNDILVQWGEAGDWQKTVDALYEIRFLEE